MSIVFFYCIPLHPAQHLTQLMQLAAVLSHFYETFIPVAVTIVRLMADLSPLPPPALTSLLSTSLPRGFAVGPSQLCAGRLGLWWVGRSLGAGSLLGNEGDTEWPWKHPVDCGRSSLAVSSLFKYKETEKRLVVGSSIGLCECVLSYILFVFLSCRFPWRQQWLKKPCISSGSGNMPNSILDQKPEVVVVMILVQAAF